MVTWDNALQTCKDLASDSTTASATFFKRLMNVGYKFILAELGKPVTERTATASSVASQQAYQLPPDYLFTKSIKYTIDGNVYPLIEEESQEMWDYMNQQSAVTGVPRVYFIRPRFGFNGAEILLYPTPAAANDTITIVYEATDKDLSQDAYTTGNCVLTNGSATVTGGSSAPTWTSAMVNRYFRCTDAQSDGLYYKVRTRNGATSITLENVYEGDSLTNVNYEIVEIFSLPEEMQILPVYFALHHYFAARKDEKQEQKYVNLFGNGLLDGKRRHATKGRGSVIRGNKFLSRFGLGTPGYFPSSGISS